MAQRTKQRFSLAWVAAIRPVRVLVLGFTDIPDHQPGAGTVLNVLKPEPDSSIVIFGLGTVGLTALMGAKYLKVKQIIAVDIQASKLPMATELGATDVVNAREVKDVVAHIKELTGGAGANYAVDCSGVPRVIEDMLNCIGMFGKAATVGVAPTGAKISIDPLQWLLGSKTYVGVREGKARGLRGGEDKCSRLMILEQETRYPLSLFRG